MCIANLTFDNAEFEVIVSIRPEVVLTAASILYLTFDPKQAIPKGSREYFISNENPLRVPQFEDKGRRNYTYNQDNNLPKGHKSHSYARRMMHCNKVHPVLATE